MNYRDPGRPMGGAQLTNAPLKDIAPPTTPTYYDVATGIGKYYKAPTNIAPASAMASLGSGARNQIPEGLFDSSGLWAGKTGGDGRAPIWDGTTPYGSRNAQQNSVPLTGMYDTFGHADQVARRSALDQYIKNTYGTDVPSNIDPTSYNPMFKQWMSGAPAGSPPASPVSPVGGVQQIGAGSSWLSPASHSSGASSMLGQNNMQPQAPMLGVQGQSSAPGLPAQATSKFADGGMVGGAPAAPSGPPTGPGMPQQGQQAMNPQLAQAHMADMLAKNPQVTGQLSAVIQHAIQTGQISPPQLHMAVQMCQAVLNNPALWPQLRNFAVQRGLCGPNDLPQQYDQGLVLTILTAAKAYEQSQGGQQGAAMMQGQPGQPPQQGQPQGMANGGMVRGPGTGTSDSVPAQNTSTGQPAALSNGEFVIPADVVAAKGKDFFDTLVRKYHGLTPRQ